MIPGPHRMKGGAPLLGARPGQSGPFGPFSTRMPDAEDVEIELLVVPDCAAERLRQALGQTGLHPTGFTTRVIADQAEAERTGFTNSPTS